LRLEGIPGSRGSGDDFYVLTVAPRLAAEVLRLREVLREYCVCGLEITALEADRE
jgi:hypothetical protein